VFGNSSKVFQADPHAIDCVFRRELTAKFV
jgi:hypothetical protein